MDTGEDKPNVTGRRRFLAQLTAAATSAFAAGQADRADGSPAEDPGGPLPTIQLGRHRVSRLIAGWNPIAGHSYMGPFMDRHMREYFTVERTVAFLRRCESAGISAWQFDHHEKGIAAIRALRQGGSKMKFICLHAARSADAPVEKVVADTDPIAIVHHGGVTDKLFREGKSQQVHDFVKRVHDAGVMAGVSAHNPECIKRVADEGWPVDLFMTCFYYLTRPPEELQKMEPVPTLKVGHYPFFASDPMKMTEVVRQVDQPCLGFKILAAGRKCRHQQSVREAFRFAFDRIKPTDAVLVGMYPRFHDQVRENAGYARQFGLARST
ncbi:MAG TPA: hypothetical protein EYH34_17730 [Planctomycetes bacterium]|nr:hypothetical protein [Planctomycetota bacterium]